METLLEELYQRPVVRDSRYAAASAKRRINAERLRRTLTKEQRRQLLRVVDACDARADCESRQSFREGMRFGVRLLLSLADRL